MEAVPKYSLEKQSRYSLWLISTAASASVGISIKNLRDGSSMFSRAEDKIQDYIITSSSTKSLELLLQDLK